MITGNHCLAAEKWRFEPQIRFYTVVVAGRKDKCSSRLPCALLSNPKEQLAIGSVNYVHNGYECTYVRFGLIFYAHPPPGYFFLGDRRHFQHINAFTIVFRSHVVTLS